MTVMAASRFLDLAEFGTFALAWAAAVIANSFVFTGFYQALLRSPDPERDRDTIYWLIFSVGAFSALVIGSVGLVAGGMATQAGQILGTQLLKNHPISHPFSRSPAADSQSQNP